MRLKLKYIDFKLKFKNKNKNINTNLSRINSYKMKPKFKIKKINFIKKNFKMQQKSLKKHSLTKSKIFKKL